MGEFILLAVIIGLIAWCLWPMISHQRSLKKKPPENKQS